MLHGIKLKANPTKEQKIKLSQWMGCARYIWNTKIHHDKSERLRLSTLKEKEYPKIDQTYSHFKSKEETPWLFECPSVILRNSIANWKETYQNFFKKRCGRPQYKKKDGKGSIYLTRELFSFQKGEDGVKRLFIGGKKYSIGHLSLKNHCSYREPASIYIKKRYDQYWVSFCYEKEESVEPVTSKEHLKNFSLKTEEELNQCVIGIDRGVARPVQTSYEETFFDLTAEEKVNKSYLEQRIKYYQKKLSRQQKGSNRRYKTKVRLGQRHASVANIRDNFCHQVSRKLVDHPTSQVIVFENLGTKRMTKKPKAKQDANGKYLPNKAKAKAGLTKNILDKNWYKLEVYTQYKAQKAGKAFFKVAPNHTSQECAHCHHIHPDNRKGQQYFSCLACGHTDNADYNAAKVIKRRAIQLILNSGTELSTRGVLSPIDKGRGADVRHKKATKPTCAVA